MQGKKTHKQFQRTLERKPDIAKRDDLDAHPENSHSRAPRDKDARQSEYAVSRQGMHQEDRQHNNERQDEEE